MHALVLIWLAASASTIIRAEVILRETFEQNGGTCGTQSYDLPLRYTENSITVQSSVKHSGNCAGSAHYALSAGGDGGGGYLRHPGAFAPNQTFHGVYWTRFHATPSTGNVSGGWCRHQKTGRFYMNSNGVDQDDWYMSVLHPYGYNNNTQLLYASSIAQSADPASCCHGTGCITDNTPCTVCQSGGCNCSLVRNGSFSIDQWIKVEFMLTKKNTCSTAQQCVGCTDQARIWIDGALVLSRDNMNFGAGATRPFRNFWLFGNASNDQSSVSCDDTVYIDDICIDNGTECIGGAISAPTLLVVAAPNRTMTWANNASGNTNMVTQKSTDGGVNWADLHANLAANATTDNDPGATGAAKYRVVTRSAGIDSFPSNVVDAPAGVVYHGGIVGRGFRVAVVLN